MIREHNDRNDLKIVVTSATLDIYLFSSYFGNCPTVEIPGRMFPVEVIYMPPLDQTKISSGAVAEVVQCVVDLHCTRMLDEGDILAFLPGQKDVDEAISLIERQFRSALKTQEDPAPPLFQLLPLYGQQEPDEQRPVFLPSKANHRYVNNQPNSEP